MNVWKKECRKLSHEAMKWCDVGLKDDEMKHKHVWHGPQHHHFRRETGP